MTVMEEVDLKTSLNRRVIADVKGLKIYTKTMTLLGGQSNAGKTALALNICDSVVKSGRKVMYVDTDEHAIKNRPDPNLLSHFRNENENGYASNFKYFTSFDEDEIIRLILEFKPDLLVIDTIYSPFIKIIEKGSLTRARRIKEFLLKLRDVIIQQDTAIILTTQVMKGTSGSDQMVYDILGGEGLKHLSDTKWMLNFERNGQKDIVDAEQSRRQIMIDKQEIVLVTFARGGVIEEVLRDSTEYEKKQGG